MLEVREGEGSSEKEVHGSKDASCPGTRDRLHEATLPSIPLRG